MDYHRQEQQFGQPLPPLVDDRMLYCPRPVMAGMSSPYDGFIRQYAGAGCATLPHHLPHHLGGAMPPLPLGYGQQVAPPVGYLPPPSLHMSAAYAGARQYLNSMMSSPPMLVPHSHSALYPSADSHAHTPPIRPTPTPVSHMTIAAASAGENSAPKDAMLTQPPKLIPASVASRNREVNLSLKPPPLKSHPNKSKVSVSPSILHSPPRPAAHTPYSAGELTDRSSLLSSYASSALHAWNRSAENRCSDGPAEQSLDLTIRSLLTSKPATAGTTTVTAVKTEMADMSSSDETAANVMVDGATYSADERKYTCLACSYATARVSKIRQHMKAHTNGQLICEDCGKAFIQTCDLERHLNAHLHGRARNTGSKFNMAAILLPRESSENCSDLPGTVHRHGDTDAASVVPSEHARDIDGVDLADWHAKSPPYSEHALSTQLSLPSMHHSNSCTSSDGDLAIVNSYSVSQRYHDDSPADRDCVARNVAPGESEVRGGESEAGVVATQSLSEAALMRESYCQHLDAVHTSPPAGTVPKVAGGNHTAVAMETTGSESAAMQTSPHTTAPPGERTVLDEAGSAARRSPETAPQRNTDISTRFPYSGALAQAARDVNDRFGVSTSALEGSANEDEDTIRRNIAHETSETHVQRKHSEDIEDTNQQKTPVTPSRSSVSQQLIDHLLQSDDESPSPSQAGNDSSDALLSPQGALSSLPMFSEPPPMYLPDGSTSDAANRALPFSPTDIVSPPPLIGGVSLCCTLCNYTGRSQRSLQKHYKAHSMSYKICSYCGKAFERPSDLLRHEERHQMALQRNHTPVIVRGGNFSHRKSLNGGATGAGIRAKAKHARVLHCRRCGFATTEHHILALHNKKQHQPSNWFCNSCGQKFISKTSLELHSAVAHPVVPVRIDSYLKNVLTDTKVFSCVIGGNNYIQLDDVNGVWFDTVKEQEVPTVSSVTDLQVIVGQTIKHMSDVADFGDRPVDLSTSHDRDDVMSQDDLIDDSVHMTDVTNDAVDATSQNDTMDISDSRLPEAALTPDDMSSSPARSLSCDSLAAPDTPTGELHVDPVSGSLSGDASKVSVKQREPRQPRVGRYTCDQCSYSSNILRKMTQHRQAHGGRYICKICYKAFIKTSDLTRHWITHGITLDGELKCDTCDYHSGDRESLEVHMKSHYHQRGTYRTRAPGKHHRPCTICHEWVYKKAMRRHLLRVHNWPPGDSTASKPAAAEPSKVSPAPVKKSLAGKAKTKKPVVVPKASGAASVKTPPGGGKSNHSGYTCPECSESFSSSRAIIQHLLVAHPGDRVAPHGGKKQIPSSTTGAVCEMCNREFADTIRLARHKAWHTRVSHPSRRQCPICHKQFKTVTYLNQHMQLHSNQKPYECDRCGATFGLHQTLLKHQQRNCSPLRRRMHHVAGEVVATKDGDHNNYAHTNGDSDTRADNPVK